MIFPIFDFDILRCFPELIASARALENCPASPHLQQVANIAGAGGESLSHPEHVVTGFLRVIWRFYFKNILPAGDGRQEMYPLNMKT